LLQLFTFIQADLRTHKPSSRSAPGALASGFEDNPESKDEPTFPKSLFLLQPLFTAYELNPVAEHAQASVPVPDGLSLDVWIVPPPPSAEPQQVEDDTPAERKAKKTKKGKDKDLNGVKGKEGKKKKRYDGMEDALTVPDETSEEQAERERVSCSVRKANRNSERFLCF
jgi:AP-3 complex subunit delta-1